MSAVSKQYADSIYSKIWDSHLDKSLDRTEHILALRALSEAVAGDLTKNQNELCRMGNVRLSLFQCLEYVYDNYCVPKGVKSDLDNFRIGCNKIAHHQIRYSESIYMLGVKSLANFVKYLSEQDIPTEIADLFNSFKEGYIVHETMYSRSVVKLNKKRIITFVFDINKNEDYAAKLVYGIRQMYDNIVARDELRNCVNSFVLNSGEMSKEHNMAVNAINVEDLNNGILSSINLTAALKSQYREDDIEYKDKSMLVIFSDSKSTSISEVAKSRMTNLVNDDSLMIIPIKLTDGTDLEVFKNVVSPYEINTLDINCCDELFKWLLQILND